MKKNILKTVIAAGLICMSLNAGAQESMKTGYFIDGYNFRHQMNPALASSRGYFSLPAIGNVNASLHSNMSLGTFIYPYNGQMTTFMSSSVSSEQFLSQLRNNNKLGVSTSVPIISAGGWGKNGGFTTFEWSVKANVMTNIPYDLFDFMKNIGARQEYNIGNLGVKANAYMELALGHAHKITDRLDIGVKVKFLINAANAEARIDNMNIKMGEDKWSVDASGFANVAVPGLNIPSKGESGTAETQDQNNEIDFSNARFGFENENISDLINGIFSDIGYGAALDLGAAYKFDSGLLEGLNLSAAVLDLGFISTGNMQQLKTSMTPWSFEGFEDLSLDSESDKSLDKQFDALTEGFEDLFRFEKAGMTKKMTMLSFILNIGAEYEMPFYRKMSVGFLSSTRFSGPYSYSEGRFSLNLEPTKWFALSTSYGISSFGSTWGAILNFSFPGLGLFVGTDNIPLNYTGYPLGIPYKTGNVSVNFGLTFNVSKVKALGDRR